jgi:tetratricopeptide (TPR) repeat protein
MAFPVALVLWLSLAVAERPPDAADLARLQSEKNVGLADLEEDRLPEAKKRFDLVRRLAPGEALGWADGAVAAMRGKDLAEARRLLAEALRLSPSDARIWALEGQRRELAGDSTSAVEAYEKAAAADPRDLSSRWSAARLLLEKGAGDRTRAIRALRSAVQQAPSNVFLLLRLFEAEREAPDRSAAVATAGALRRALETEIRSDAKLEKYFGEGVAALESGDARTASLRFRLVENLLRNSSRYQQARHDVDPGVLGIPLEDWSPALAARMRARGRAVPVRFVQKTNAALSGLRGLAAVRAFGRDGRDLAFAGEAGLQVAAAKEALRPSAPLPGSASRFLAVADIANSGQLDLITPGAVWHAEKSGYRRTALAPGDRVLAVDYDNDGDLDLYVSSRSGDRLLRNNLDGTWADVTASALPARPQSRAAVSADFDRDGDADVVLARAGGGLVLLDNLRGGRFAEREAGLPRAGAFSSVAAGDLNGDGRPDLVWTSDSAAYVALNRGDGTFLPATELPGGGTPLLFDFDNDGALDLFLASPNGSVLFRNDGAGRFARVDANLPPARDAAAVDVDGDGDLDLVLVTAAGGAALYENDGGNANAWIDVALEALPTGSAKVNRFGYGSEVEVKSGELYVFRTVSSPVTHVGLGAARHADVLRVLWTNGIPQNALSPSTRTLVREVQQLKGSCPFLYAFDGRRWNFVTDVLGASPMGLLYDGLHQAPANTREWLVVGGDRLAAAPDGMLRLDLTEELWEAAYIDLAELSAVDHPAGVELVANEKMVPPPFPRKALFSISRPRTPRATDGRGRDRTADIASVDGRFIADFPPTRYQGIVEPHDLVLELPEAAGATKVMLYLTGWIFYSDTSIQVSLAQGNGIHPAPPELDVPDGRGGWKVAIPAMGYPIGKTKTIPVDLSDVLDRRDPRVRIRTNLAIFWDRITYTVDESPAPIRITRAPLSSARLFFRGFSLMVREPEDGPHVFLHDDVDTTPHWADMAGLYTRFGDVRELLAVSDDRYVVMKGGDAIRLEFDGHGLPDLPPGWTRDWLFVSDGWEKDADKNTVAGQTVEPLPFHGMDDARYGQPQPVPDDEAHRRFRSEYLTRRGGPEELVDAVRNSGKRETENGKR